MPDWLPGDPGTVMQLFAGALVGGFILGALAVAISAVVARHR